MWRADQLEGSFADFGVPLGKLMSTSQQWNPFAMISCVLGAFSKSDPQAQGSD